MREILFKGKRVDNGEWVEGFYVNVPEHYKPEMSGKSYIVSINNGISFAVIPETVGQYTGLKGKNGKKIFEGDIIETQEYYDKPYSAKKRKKRYIGIVEYVTYKHNNGIYYEAKWYVNIKDFDTYVYGAWSRFYDCTVIGNIHDNPELLQEDEQ